MPDYHKMYYIVCDGASRALDALPMNVDEAMKALQRALNEAEERYIETSGDTAE